MVGDVVGGYEVKELLASGRIGLLLLSAKPSGHRPVIRRMVTQDAVGLGVKSQKKRVLAVLALSGLMACTPGHPCASEADCAAFGGVCDTELKVCAIGDGGTSAADGGGTCTVACGAGQTCRPSAGGGACVQLTVRVNAPLPNSTYGGGASVRLLATVTDWDGGPWGGTTIPASGSSGVVPPASLTRVDAGQYAGDYRLPSIAGRHTLTAGWPGANDSVPVLAQVCTAACADWEECAPSSDGGVCTDLGLTLTWTSPTENQKFAPNANVPLALTVTRADSRPFTRDVPYTVNGGSPGTLQFTGTSWTGGTNSGAVEATRTLLAGWSGGPQSGTRNFIVDATPPSLTLLIRSDGGAYQRDAIIPAVIISSERVADAGVTLGGLSMPRIADSNCADIGAFGAVGCYELDFSQPALNGISGAFHVVLRGTDEYGNSGASDGGPLTVTRERWVTCPAGCAAGTDVTAMSVAPDGGLYLGYSKSPLTGAILMVSPVDGRALLTWDAGAVQSLASHNDLAYFAMNNGVTGGQIGAVGPSAIMSPTTLSVATKLTYSGIALVEDATRGVGALGSINFSGTNGVACVYFPMDPDETFGSGTTYDSYAVSSTSSPTAAVNVVVSRAATASPIASFLRKPGTMAASWQPVADFFLTASSPTTAPNLTASSFIPPFGQALLPDGGLLIAVASSGTDDSIFVGEWAGVASATTRSGNLGGGSSSGVPVVATSREAYAGHGRGLYRFDPDALDASTPVVDDGGTDNFYLSPVLTKDQPEDGGIGLGYAISADGILVAFTRTPSVRWQAAASEPVLTHPTMDCNRQSTRTKTGLLYVGAKGGRVRAFVVDSPGLLDAPDAWPKYQRSMGNAGNDDLTNFPTNWPGCP